MTTFWIDFYALAYREESYSCAIRKCASRTPPPPHGSYRETKHRPMFRIRIRSFRIRIQGFDDQKLERKKLQLKKNLICFWSKIAIDLSLVLHKGRASYRRSLQPPKEHIQHLKTWNFVTFFIFVGHFCSPIWIHWPDWIRIQSGSETLAQASPFRKSSILSLSGSVGLHQQQQERGMVGV